MPKEFSSDILNCSGCEKELPNGGIVYVLCEHCIQAFGIGIVDTQQLTLFEMEGSSEIH